MIRRSRRHSQLASAALLGVAMWLATGTARADARQVDSRWQAWLGCWAPLTADDVASSRDQVCVIPTDTPSAVEFVTVTGESIASRDRIDVTGARRASQQDGCTGWDEITWSSDGRRIYRRSEHSCPDGSKRSSTGLLAMTPKGEWLDVLAASIDNNSGVRVLRHRRRTSASTLLSADVRAILTEHAEPINAAWTTASAPIGTGPVIEASHHVSISVVQAWLSEVSPTFSIDARRLVELANAGVSGRVTDLLVALAYPGAFSVRSASRDSSSSSSLSFPGSYGGYTEYGAMLAACRDPWNGCLYGWPYVWGYGPYYGYLRYGYAPYGSWYSGNDPWEVVPGGGSGGGASSPSTTHGQVTRSGYVERRDGDAGAASPRSEPAGSSSGSAPASSDSSSSSGSSSTPSSSPSDGGRTAHPR